jgi:hypothetical protein
MSAVFYDLFVTQVANGWKQIVEEIQIFKLFQISCLQEALIKGGLAKPL